jgi:hypothetical protein
MDKFLANQAVVQNNRHINPGEGAPWYQKLQKLFTTEKAGKHHGESGGCRMDLNVASDASL